MRKYMVVETFFRNRRDEIYDRLAQSGRMIPDGLRYLDSWLENDGDRCFQLMETENPDLFECWVKHWEDLASFEVIELGDKPSDDV